MKWQRIYNNGINAWNQKNYHVALYWFKQSLQHKEYRVKSIANIFSIYLCEGRYDLARDFLENLYNLPNIFFINNMYARLETVEMNFTKGKNYYHKSYYDDEYYSTKAKLNEAKINMELGEFEIASRELSTITHLDYKYLKSEAKMEQVNLAILHNKYKKAFNIFKEIDLNDLPIEIIRNLENINIHLLYCLGYKDERYIQKYLYKVLILQDEEELINHIKRHISFAGVKSDGFLSDINVFDLINETKEKIKDLNPRYRGNTNIYIVRTDKVVGLVDGIYTKDYCAVCLLGTETIITMYPIMLSKEFNKEGLLYSKELKLKREKNLNKNK